MSEGSFGTQVAIPSTTEGVATPAAPSVAPSFPSSGPRPVTGTTRIGLDIETWPIGPGAPYPRPVCITWAEWTGDGVSTGIASNGDSDWLACIDTIFSWLEADPAFASGGSRVATREIVWHNGHGFDVIDLSLHYPHLIPRAFDAYIRKQIRETWTREQLLNLAISGNTDFYFTPDGVAREIRYKLETLVAKYLGRDRSREKGFDAEGNLVREDVWRLNFNSLDGVPSAQFPDDAAAYAKQDAVDALLISYAQDAVARDVFVTPRAVLPDGRPFDVFGVEWLHSATQFSLSFMTSWGFRVDAAEVAKIQEAVAQALRPEQTNLLFESGLYSLPRPARPYSNGSRHVMVCAACKKNTVVRGGACYTCGGVERVVPPCSCAAPSHEPGAPKMVPADLAHRNNKRLLEMVVKAWAANRLCDDDKCPRAGQECSEHGLGPLKRTEPSKQFPDGQISCDGEVIEMLAPFDPVLMQYSHFKLLEKIQTLELPRLVMALDQGGIIRPTFKILKKTGRTSSGRSKLFASINVQQIPRAIEVDEVGPDGKRVLDAKGNPKIIRIEPRRAYLPRTPGWAICSVDFSFLELCTLASQVFKLLGRSKLRDVINSGADPHAWLAAQLAHGTHADFVEYCRAEGASEPDPIYALFAPLKHGTDDQRKFYKSYRNLAKPTGLALGGGMGPRRLVEYAWTMYGVVIASVDAAKALREIWMTSFSEMRWYLRDFMETLLETGDESLHRRYYYFTPMGMLRRKTSYTETANGYGLQSPAAEGGALAIQSVVRACWDESRKSCLFGCRPLAWVHDEMLVEMPLDGHEHARAFEVSRLMIECMETITTGVKIRAEPALSERWEKNVESCYDENDRLQVWRPGVKYPVDAQGKLRVPR